MNKRKAIKTVLLVAIAAIVVMIIFNVIGYVIFDMQRQGKDFDVNIGHSGFDIFSLETSNDKPVSIELYSNSRFELKRYETDDKIIQSHRILNIWTIKTNIEPGIKWRVEGVDKIQVIVKNQEYTKLVLLFEVALFIVNPFNAIVIILTFLILEWYLTKKYTQTTNNP